MRPLLIAALAAVLLLPASAGAYVVQERGGLESSTNGITLGPDGNLWAVEQAAGKVVRMKPDGTVLGHFAVGPAPTSITTGPGGRVWVSVTGADKLVWFDATSATPAPHDVSIADHTDCGPVAVEAGNNGRIYFSAPGDGSCSASGLGYTKDDGSGGTAVFEFPRVFDLHVLAGKLYAPLFDADVIRRLALDDALTTESSVTVSAGSNPNGITADNSGRIWVTLYTGDRVAYFPATQQNGAAAELAPVGGTINDPFGIVVGPDGGIYVTGNESASLARIDPTTLQWGFFAVPGAKPWQIVNGPDEDLWFSDRANSRLLRFVNNKPRATTEAASAIAATTATLNAKVDPRGNATSVVFDYGTTAAFGRTTAPVNVAEGVGSVDVQATVGDLAPSTIYHVRARATNALGETVGSTVTFTTAAAPPVTPGPEPQRPTVTPRLTALPAFSWKVSRTYTRLTKVRATRLAGGETVRITCKGRGCPFKKRTYTKVKAGTRRFDSLFRRKRLRPKTQVQMRITKPGAIGAVTTVKIRRARKPLLVRRCLQPGASVPTKC